MAVHVIYKYLIADDSDDENTLNRTLANMKWFSSTIPETEFYDINRYLWILIKNASSISIPLTVQNLQGFITLYLKRAIANTGIHITGTESLNFQDPVDLEKAYRVISANLQTEVELVRSIDTDNQAFDVVALDFFNERKKSLLIDAYTKGMQILETGYRNMQGSDDSLEFVKQALYKADYIYSPKNIELLSKKKEDAFESKFIIDTGITEVDKDTLGIFTGQVFGIEAGSGVGKTRFAIGAPTYRALLAKKNVCYCAMEQSEKEIKAMAIARHVFEVFGHHVEDRDIFKNRVPMELREEVANAEYDLFKSGKYGNLYVHEELLYDNTLTDTLATLNSHQGPFDLFVIDHMYLLEHKATKYEPYLSRHDIIANGYRYLKRFTKRQPWAIIALNQLNKTGMEFVAADKCPPQDGAAGGLEVYRNTDYNMVLGCTPAMKAQNKMRVFIPKVRSSAGDISPLLRTQLWNCYFISEPGENI